MAATALQASLIFYPNSSPKTLTVSSFRTNLQIPNSPKHILSPLSTTKKLNHLGASVAAARNTKSSKLYCSPAQVTTLEAKPEETQQVVGNKKRKLYVTNWPWTYSVEDLKELFGQCGVVTDVEFIKNKDGKGRNFGFVTMATGEEAQAVLEKFDSYEVAGRIIRVDFAKQFKKHSPKPPNTFAREVETPHQLYVSNLAWKVRISHLREFFAESIKPVSSKVVFDARKSAGYGFVSFATREEAEAAIAAFNGKDLMGRPVRLKLNEKRKDNTGSESQGEDNSETQADTVSENQEDNSETQTEVQ